MNYFVNRFKDRSFVHIAAAGFLLGFILTLTFPARVFSETTDPRGEEAFSVDPMEMKFALVPGAPLSSKLRVKNQSDAATRIRIDVFERTNELDGSERRSPTKNLKLSESEFDLAAGTEKAIEVSYRGSLRLKNERAYRVVVKQVDAARAVEAGTSLDLRFIYVASVYVSPDKAKSKLLVDRVRRLDDKKVEVEFSNKGTAHQKLSGLDFKIRQKITGKERRMTVSESSRRQLSRMNILARGRLRTVLEVAPDEVLTDGSTIDVSF